MGCGCGVGVPLASVCFAGTGGLGGFLGDVSVLAECSDRLFGSVPSRSVVLVLLPRVLTFLPSTLTPAFRFEVSRLSAIMASTFFLLSVFGRAGGSLISSERQGIIVSTLLPPAPILVDQNGG